MKKLSKTKLGILALLTCASITTYGADNPLQIHGYATVSGDFGTSRLENGDLSVAGIHLDPNGDARGKLGNLGNSYWHDNVLFLTLSKRWESENGSWTEYTATLENYGNHDTYTGNNYASFGGLSFLPKDSSIWAGRRGLGESELVFGLALKDIGLDAAVGYNSKKIDITYGTSNNGMANVDSATSGNDELVEGARNVLDVVYRLGKVELNLTYVKEITDQDLSHIYNPNGNPGEKSTMSVSAKYSTDKFLGLLPGATTYRAQFGKGVIAQYLNTSRITGLSTKDDTSMRFTINGRINGLTNWTIMPSVVYETTDRDGFRLDGTAMGFDGKEQTVLLGLSASQKINNNFSMLYEVNVNNTQNKDSNESVDGSAYKIAAGPALQLEVNEWVRPIIKLSTAVVGGDKKISGLTKDSEVRIGYSMETWF